jgi:hypothetical protein
MPNDQRLQPAAFSIAEFCARNDLCRRSLYNYWEAGVGPRYFKVGARRLITAEAESDWHRQREAETAGNAAA